MTWKTVSFSISAAERCTCDLNRTVFTVPGEVLVSNLAAIAPIAGSVLTFR